SSATARPNPAAPTFWLAPRRPAKSSSPRPAGRSLDSVSPACPQADWRPRVRARPLRRGRTGSPSAGSLLLRSLCVAGVGVAVDRDRLASQIVEILNHLLVGHVLGHVVMIA